MTIVFPFSTSCHRIFTIGQDKRISFVDFCVVFLAADFARLCTQRAYRSLVTRIEPLVTNGRDIKARCFEQTLFRLRKGLYCSKTWYVSRIMYFVDFERVVFTHLFFLTININDLKNPILYVFAKRVTSSGTNTFSRT